MSAQDALFALVIERYGWALQPAMTTDLVLSLWSSFKRLVEPAVLKGPDGAAVELQHVLAMEVAELVVPRLSAEEYVKAMAGALQWRAPAALAQVKQVLVEKPEAKPVLRGRQSCLFLHLLDGEGEELASVVL